MDLQKEYYEIEDFGGFLLRLVAYIIDGAILGVISMILSMFMMGPKFLEMASQMEDEPDTAQMMEIMGSMGMFTISIIVVQWLYFAVMESSKNQATLGKMAVGLKVTDMFGDPISFGRATGRHFAKIISGLIMMIGYLMVAFTEKRQGLHDILASTLVLKKNVPPLQ